MRKRLVFAAACILALPLLFTPSQSEKLTNPTAFSTVALAGHTNIGNWCDCGTPGCICDPGENPVGGQSASPVSDRNGRSLNQDATPARGNQASGFDFGSSALMLALGFFLWTRFRA